MKPNTIIFSNQLEPCAGRAAPTAAANLWAPPPIFDDRRAADAMLLCLVISLHFYKKSSENFEDRMKYLGNLLNKFMVAHAVPRRRLKLTQ